MIEDETALENFLIKIDEFIKAKLEKDKGHGYNHCKRVYNLCKYIGKLEEADMFILLPAALLHDVARDEEDGKTSHAELSANTADNFLRKIGYPEDKIRNIVSAIRRHSFRLGLDQNSLEARILSDADKLDAIGAIGVYRAFITACHKNESVGDVMQHFHDKLSKLKFHTKCAKKIAKERKKLIKKFFIHLEEEIKGEK